MESVSMVYYVFYTNYFFFYLFLAKEKICLFHQKNLLDKNAILHHIQLI